MKQPKKNFLTSEERALIRSQHRRERDGRSRDRLKTILLLDAGWSYETIADVLLLDHNTIRRYYETYQSDGIDALILMNYKGREPNLSSENEEVLKQHLRENTYLSAAEVGRYIESTFKVKYSNKGTTNLLHRLGFSYKKPKVVPGKSDPEKQRQFIEEYEKLQNTREENSTVLFMDGVHPQHNAKPAYGWIETGKNKELLSNTGRQRININGVIEPNTLEITYREDQSINALSTIELFKEIELKYCKKSKIYIVCDNARYYRSKLVQEYLRTSKIELKFLPPYSPNLNLIERLWRFMHKKVTYNQYYEKFCDFRSALLDFFDNINDYAEELKTLFVQKFYIMKNSQS